MAGVHSLKHVESFTSPDFADDNSVRSHTKRVLNEFALANFTLAFDIGRARFQTCHVRLLKLKLPKLRTLELVLRGDGRGRRQEPASSAWTQSKFQLGRGISRRARWNGTRALRSWSPARF